MPLNDLILMEELLMQWEMAEKLDALPFQDLSGWSVFEVSIVLKVQQDLSKL